MSEPGVVAGPAAARPPAGWYPDPAGGSGLRWWDGTTWTDSVQAPIVSIDAGARLPAVAAVSVPPGQHAAAGGAVLVASPATPTEQWMATTTAQGSGLARRAYRPVTAASTAFGIVLGIVIASCSPPS